MPAMNALKIDCDTARRTSIVTTRIAAIAIVALSLTGAASMAGMLDTATTAAPLVAGASSTVSASAVHPTTR
jgi:ABC-type Na+ efflux pump permease subunit